MFVRRYFILMLNTYRGDDSTREKKDISLLFAALLPWRSFFLLAEQSIYSCMIIFYECTGVDQSTNILY
jgi:hypothetical protein